MTAPVKADEQAREIDKIEPDDYWGFLARRAGPAQEAPSAGPASLLPWETHNPGDLDGDRVNVICPGANVVILANAEIDAARLIVAEHNRADVGQRAALVQIRFLASQARPAAYSDTLDRIERLAQAGVSTPAPCRPNAEGGEA